jgi:hypothetical protein
MKLHGNLTVWLHAYDHAFHMKQRANLAVARACTQPWQYDSKFIAAAVVLVLPWLPPLHF